MRASLRASGELGVKAGDVSEGEPGDLAIAGGQGCRREER